MSYDTTKPYKAQILDLIRSTWQAPYATVYQCGQYPLVIPRHCCQVEFDHTDGIGTKGVLHWYRRSFAEAAQDALAMNLNDLLTVGAIPYKLQNHLIVPEDDHGAILEIIGHLCELCRKHGICVTGGETAIHSNIEGMELSLTVSGFVPREMPFQAKDGDYIVGLPSTGPHSNGYTLLQQCHPNPPITATCIYERPEVRWNAMVHVAGGAYTRLKGMLSDTLDIEIAPTPDPFWHPVYRELRGTTVNADEMMYATFNCGYGLIMAVDPEEYDHKLGTILGSVKPGTGKVRIQSAFSEKWVIF